ncbi:Eukaryotic peptide chain release factor GTP-binding subunit [Entomortierella beljakovae]|nr:Eukaryotic peptide chain release factor GTP-binding subunit [Entomortierella beljakovae]
MDSSSNRSASTDSNPLTDNTAVSIINQSTELESEELKNERLEYQLKGQSRGFPSGFSIGKPTDKHPLNPRDSTQPETKPERISIQKNSVAPSPSNRPIAPGDSSEVLPLSQFLSQPMDSVKMDNQSTNSSDSVMNPTFLSAPPSFPSSQPGRILITSASGDFSGYQQVHLEHDQNQCKNLPTSTRSNLGVNNSSNNHHETHPSGTDNAVAAISLDQESDSLNQGKAIRNYKVFPGRNMFFCGGRIMTSHDFPAFFMAVMLVLVPTGLFYGFSASYLWHRLSPATPIVHGYVFIVAFSSMLKTSWTDPGIIPRGIDGDPPTDPPMEPEPNSFAFYPPHAQPRIKEVQVGNYTIRLKYCDTCKIYRPPRCSHCRQCDNCVEDEDHHCIWLNNCIGRRNYRFFLLFVSTMSIYAFLTSALSLTHLLVLYHDKRDAAADPKSISFARDAMAKEVVPVIVMIFACMMGIAVGSLACYHFWLATKNRTTHEELTASMMRPHVVDNPYDRGGIFKNCAAVLFRPPTRRFKK